MKVQLKFDFNTKKPIDSCKDIQFCGLCHKRLIDMTKKKEIIKTFYCRKSEYWHKHTCQECWDKMFGGIEEAIADGTIGICDKGGR